MKFTLSFLLLVTSFVCAHETQSEIKVRLNTRSNLKAIYVSHIHSDSSLEKSYLDSLESVLAFDMSHNGKTYLSEKSPEKEKAFESSSLDPSQASIFNSPYALSLQVKEKKLTCKLYNFVTHHANSFSEVSLTGSIGQDRRIIHKLADSVYKSLFHEPGIASSRILYSYHPHSTSKHSTWNAEIMECDWDGANPRRVTHEKSYNITPVLIPNKAGNGAEEFLYVSYKTGQPKLLLRSLKGEKSHRVSDLRGNQVLPAISQNLDKVAYICDASGRADLFVQNIDLKNKQFGKPQQLYSFPKSTQGSPTFSPDGSKIAFVSDKDGAPRIYCISSEKQKKRASPTLLTKKNRESSAPNWSPDGTKLAYSAKTGGVRQIWTYDFATREEKQLTSGPGNKENPCWASNSMHIVYNSTDNHSSDLYIVNLNQPEAVKITKGHGKKHYPSWGPR